MNDGIALLQTLINKVRDTVKYLKKSPTRMYKLLMVCKSLNMEIGRGLCLDVATRWNSTCRMVEACTVYRAAFKEYAEVDATYKW